MAGFLLMMAWVDFHIARRSHPGVYDEPHKVWATRGLVTDGSDGSPVRKKNSIESIRHAFDCGAKGTEVDVRYDPGMDVFVVSHSKRYEKRNGVLLTLEALLDALGDRGIFWLDWKSQRDLSAEENQAALARLNEVVGQGDLRKRVYVEGEAPHALWTVKEAGFLTIYDCRPRCETELLGRLLGPVLVDAYKAVYYFGGFTVMGAPGGSESEPVYGPRTRLALRNVPVFLYHLPDDPPYLKTLVAHEDVRVVLIRQDVNRFDLVAGGESSQDPDR
jgi:glycerophosphoryl diester phosphodiesterase